MAYNALNNLIDAYIYANGVQAITGQILNGVLKQMVSQLGFGYHLMGVAGPETEPASNDYAMAYFAATAGEYTDFGGITLAAGEVAVLLTSGNGSWEKQTIYNVPTTTEDLENTAGFITNAVTDLVNYYTKTEVDDTLANYPTLEALATALADYYTKTEIDAILADYTTNTALASALTDYYNKNDIDGLLSVVNAALADRYTKSETDTKLADYYKKTETYDKDEVDSIVAALSRQEYIVAWDGLAAPDVTAIPAGVTVTYSGTTYTGTLAASASTVNKIYMVWNGTAYDMYGTSQDGGYSWVPMGTTTVDLSQYATKAEVSQLEAKVDDLCGEYKENPEWIRVITDNAGNILCGIKPDGSIEWAIGVPSPVQAFVSEEIAKIVSGGTGMTINDIDKIYDFLSGFSTSDTLTNLLNEKVDKVEGKSLIDAEVATVQSIEESPEYIQVTTDNDGKVIEAIKPDGSVELSGKTTFGHIDNKEWLDLKLDSQGKILEGTRSDGRKYAYEIQSESVDRIKSALSSTDVRVSNLESRTIKKKKVSILGDSISTFNQKGYKIDGYSMWYPHQDDRSSDVVSVQDTWWKQTIDAIDGILEVNASYSGSGATTIEGRPNFAERVPLLGEPDIIYIELGGNDYENGVQIGDIDFGSDSYDMTKFAPAYIKGMRDTISRYPDAKIVCVAFDMSVAYQNAIKTIADNFGADYIYVGDISDVHPNKSEMLACSNRIIKYDSPHYWDNSPEYISVETDEFGKVLGGRDKDGVSFEKIGNKTPYIDIDGNKMDNIDDPEQRIEVVTDDEKKVISYRDNTGMLHELSGIETSKIVLSSNGLSELGSALKNSGFGKDNSDWSEYMSNDGESPLCLPIPRVAAVLNIISNTNLSSLSKEGYPGGVDGVNYNLPTQIEFWDMQGNYFKKWTSMSAQGNSSMSYPKKNLAFDFFDSEFDGDAFAVKFGDWVPQDSWHLKAYYTDAFRCVGLASYKLYDEMVKTRGVLNDYIYKRALINFDKIGAVANGYNDLDNLSLQFETGAKCFPDGFPVVVFQNGVFYGLFCWQIKKHRDNYHMKKSSAKNIHLDGTINGTTLFNGNIDWDASTGIEVRNPKDLYLMDGTKYNADTNSGELIDSTSEHYDSGNSKHVTTAAVKQYIINFSNVMATLASAQTTYNNSSKTAEDLATLKGVIETYFDIDNLIDYIILSDVVRNYDGFSKNWQWLTYDGVKWFVGLYDVDGSFGGNFTGTSTLLPLSSNGHISNTQMIGYVINYYASELNARYAELRDAKIIDAEHITGIVRGLTLAFGEHNYEKEFAKWTNCPCNRDTVVNSKWEFDLDGNGQPQLGTANYNNSATYNEGDSCYYAQYPGNGEPAYKYKAKETVTGVKPVDSFGYRDSIFRIYKWIKAEIENMDIVYSFTN